MIKILFLIDRIKAAGAQKHLMELIKGLDKVKFQPHLCLLEKNAENIQLPVPISCLNVKRIYGISGIRGLLQLVRLIRREKFDIVHSYLFSENILGTIAARIAKVKVIITSRRDTGMLVQGDWQHIFSYRITNRWVDKIICVSEAVKNVTLAKEKAAPAKVKVIYNGVNVNKFTNGLQLTTYELKQSLAIKDTEFVVGMIANFSWVKGHREFIEAARLVLEDVPNTKFLFIGEGPLKNCLQATVNSQQLEDKILFLGSRIDIPDLLSIMDVSVNASYSEGMSNTILESMASGTPVVATAVDGNIETVFDSETGFLVPPKDYKAMAGAITKILRNAPLKKSLGEKARDRAFLEFNFSSMVKSFESLYETEIRRKYAKEVT